MTVTDSKYLDRRSQSKSKPVIRVADDRTNPIEVEGRFEGIPAVFLPRSKDYLIPTEATTRTGLV